MTDDSYSYCRKILPHWRSPGSVYFVTWRLASKQPALSPDERDMVSSAIRFFQGRRYHLAAYVVIDDHIHVLFHPGDDWSVERIVQSWKSWTSHQLALSGRATPVWQREYFDRIVRDEEELHEKAFYIWSNPRKRWPEVIEYPWMYPADV